ncbi:SDR family oxidoreductase [Nocardia altamirensis]|uniref:SDR family oxidoreductase n=1 Tax=Nocardia altamirensis TaxID=472158 RepID=UPI0008401D70|nr:SDR family oxidoreductase [Nocardia altamirensis]
MSALAGKTALVTGGSRGIGRGIAERLGRDGARVAVHYNGNEEAAKDTVAAIEAAGGTAFAIRAELGVPDDAVTLWAAFDAHADGVDIIVNNAGTDGIREPIAGTDEAAFDRVFAVNTKAPFFVTKLGLDRLRDGGRIINISTGLTHGAHMPELIAYTMTKGAINTMTNVLAKEVGVRGITVNAVAPGIVDTDMNASFLNDPDTVAAITAMSPLRRLAQPAEVADVVGFLASEDGRWVTGQWIDATGGALL